MQLDFMPLAIVQAAGYIKHRSPRCTVLQYLERLRRSDRDAVQLLDLKAGELSRGWEAGRLSRDWEAENSILLTWQISFEHIRQVRVSAANLLSLMSFFDRQGISENLLRVQYRRQGQYSSSKNIVDDSSDEDMDSPLETDPGQDFEDDITTLRDYSFISVAGDRTVFTMHRLVQLFARRWLKAHDQIEQWKEKFISNLCQEFPTGEYENWERCRSLYPHVKSAMSQLPESQESLRQWAALLYRGAWYAALSGIIADAREMASKSRKQRVILLGDEDEEYLESTAMLATAYRLDGQ